MDRGSTELLMDGGSGQGEAGLCSPGGANWPRELQPPGRESCWGGQRILATACTRVMLTVLRAARGPCLSNPPGSSLTCPLCPHTGPVTNAFIVLAPANMFNPDGKPSVPLPKFSRHLHGTESSDEPGTEGVTLRLGLHQQVLGAAGEWGQTSRRGCAGAKLLLQLVKAVPAPSCFLPILAAAVICPPSPVLQHGLALLSHHFLGPGVGVPRKGGAHTISVPPIPASLSSGPRAALLCQRLPLSK